MIKTLIAVRFRGLLAGMFSRTRRKKKTGKGMMVLFALLYLYVAVVIAGAMCMLFAQLAPAYHAQGLDWLYFSMAGSMGLAFSVFGGVFMTQSQLYDAKDNDLLLSMPIRPGMILMSRMVPLLGFNLLFCGLVVLPACGMFAVLTEFSLGNLIFQLLGLVGLCFLSQAISCLLGWGLHLLLNRINRSLASAVYMVAFLGIYFGAYSQAGKLMNSLATEGASIGRAMKSWAWPLYALGTGSTGNAGCLAAFLAVCGAAFGGVYWLLARTFLKTATSRRGGKRRRLDMSAVKMASPSMAITGKEWRHFLGSPVYLTNVGLGVLMTAVLGAAGVIFRSRLEPVLDSLAREGLELGPYLPLIICAMLGFLASMMFVSAPSVSLEGKNLWILKSMPVSPRQILLAKLRFHILLTTPVTVLSGVVLAAAYGCGIPAILLCGLVPGILTVLCGMLGMVCGLKWAKLDWLSEAYPCKQGMAAFFTMFPMMALPLVLGGCCLGLSAYLSPNAFLALCALVLGGICWGLFRAIVTWGAEKWSALA